MPIKLTVGMAVAGDFYGPFYTIQQLRITHPEVLDQVEILVIHNSPPEPGADNPLQRFMAGIPNCRYVAYDEIKGTAAPRNRVFAEAQGEYVLCIDSHVFLPPGVLKRFIDYMDQRGPDCKDLLQGPMLYDGLDYFETHMAPMMHDVDGGMIMPVGLKDDPRQLKNVRKAWRGEMFGIWCSDPRAKDPDANAFEIPMQGLGLFGCRKDKWLGFSEHFRGFGGEEGYIHQKYRLAGAKTLCLPFLRWWHSFWRVGGIPYRCDKLDKLRNYMIVAAELGTTDAEAVRHFTEEIDGPLQNYHVAQLREEVKALNIQPIKSVRMPAPAPVKIDQTPPLVSCICVTAGRVKFLADVIGCFANQDYANRELVIVNSHPIPVVPGDNWPAGVSVYNIANTRDDGTPLSLGELRSIALQYAKGSLIQHWDDDDFYLRWHISSGVAGLMGQLAMSPVAWKPREHWFDWVGELTGLDTNVVECSATYFKSAIDQIGYAKDCRAGAEQLPLVETLMKSGKYSIKSVGPWTPYVYRWGQGVAHVSSTVDGETWQESIKRWRDANNDHGGGQPLAMTDGLQSSLKRYAAGVDMDYRKEWLARCNAPAIDIPSDPESRMKNVIEAYFGNRKDLTACEVGRAVTGQIAESMRVRQLVSWFLEGESTPEIAYTKARYLGKAADVCSCEFKQDKIDLLYLGDSNTVANLMYLRSLAPVFSDLCVITVESNASELAWATLAPTHSHRRVGSLDVFAPRFLPQWIQFAPAGL